MQFISEQIQKSLPEVHSHLLTLDIPPETYLYRWYVTLMHSFFSQSVAAILLDKFLIEGEVFIVKCILGVLSVFQSEIKTLTYRQATTFLLQQGNKCYDVSLLFFQIENTPISYRQYQEYLGHHAKARFNSSIYQALLQSNAL